MGDDIDINMSSNNNSKQQNKKKKQNVAKAKDNDDISMMNQNSNKKKKKMAFVDDEEDDNIGGNDNSNSNSNKNKNKGKGGKKAVGKKKKPLVKKKTTEIIQTVGGRKVKKPNYNESLTFDDSDIDNDKDGDDDDVGSLKDFIVDESGVLDDNYNSDEEYVVSDYEDELLDDRRTRDSLMSFDSFGSVPSNPSITPPKNKPRKGKKTILPDRPLCKWGKKCYRKNKQHLKDYYHPWRENN